MPQVQKSKLLSIYENCVKTRWLDERFQMLFYEGKETVRVPFGGVGSELGPSAPCAFLTSEDCLIPHYRGYAEVLGKGMPIELVAEEVLRRKTGPAMGIGDVCSFQDSRHNIYGSSITLGANFSIAAGLAYARALLHKTGIVVLFFGDGAASRSQFGSTLNLASLWNLPLLFVCLNNGFSIHVPMQKMSSTSTIAERAKGYNIESVTTRDQEPLQLAECSKDAVEYVRNNKMPYLLEILQKRFIPHSARYTSKPFLGKDIPRKEDPLYILENELRNLGVQEEEIAACGQKAREEVNYAIKIARTKPYLSKEEFFAVYHE